MTPTTVRSSGNDFVIATWGATGRGEATAGSDVDLLCWTRELAPDRKDIEHRVLGDGIEGTYLDLLLFDGSRPLAMWARATATDYQAVLFAEDIRGPQDLVTEFVAEQEVLWSDETTRAREVWMLVSETLLHPRTMARAGYFFRPEKYSIGGTRSFTTIAEAYAMLRGWTGRFTTLGGLRSTEELLRWSDGRLSKAYEKSVRLRKEFENKNDASLLNGAYGEIGSIVTDATRALILHELPWLQTHAGVPAGIIQDWFRIVFDCNPDVPQPTTIDERTRRMMLAFTGRDTDVRHILDEAGPDWFVRYAATANISVTGPTLEEVVFSDQSLDSWSNRNICLWVMRHPNLNRETAEELLSQSSHRPMDYEAAEVALARISLNESGEST